MRRIHTVLACIACGLATSALATPSTYNLLTSASATTGGAGTSSGTAWNDSSSSAYCTVGSTGCTTGGTNYGNTYTWSAASSGGNTSVTMSAFGTTTLSTTTNLQKAWIGNYGSNGFGITSQSSGELNSSHDPDAVSPTYQHAIDNTSAYESLLFSFSSAVTLNSLSIGFKGQNADATVLEYQGTGNPTASLTSQSYSSMLCASASSTNCWNIVGNLLGMSTSGANAITGGTASSYWMVGAYLPIGTNSAYSGINDAFKVSGFTATRATVPEPGSIALFGIAGAALVGSRCRRKHAA